MVGAVWSPSRSVHKSCRFAYEVRKSATPLGLTGTQLLARITPLIPPPRSNLTRYHGVFASGSRLLPQGHFLVAPPWRAPPLTARAIVVPKPPDDEEAEAPPRCRNNKREARAASGRLAHGHRPRCAVQKDSGTHLPHPVGRALASDLRRRRPRFPGVRRPHEGHRVPRGAFRCAEDPPPPRTARRPASHDEVTRAATGSLRLVAHDSLHLARARGMARCSLGSSRWIARGLVLSRGVFGFCRRWALWRGMLGPSCEKAANPSYAARCERDRPQRLGDRARERDIHRSGGGGAEPGRDDLRRQQPREGRAARGPLRLRSSRSRRPGPVRPITERPSHRGRGCLRSRA